MPCSVVYASTLYQGKLAQIEMILRRWYKTTNSQSGWDRTIKTRGERVKDNGTFNIGIEAT